MYGLHTIMYAVCMTDRQTFTGKKRHLMKTYKFKGYKKVKVSPYSKITLKNPVFWKMFFGEIRFNFFAHN